MAIRESSKRENILIACVLVTISICFFAGISWFYFPSKIARYLFSFGLFSCYVSLFLFVITGIRVKNPNYYKSNLKKFFDIFIFSVCLSWLLLITFPFLIIHFIIWELIGVKKIFEVKPKIHNSFINKFLKLIDFFYSIKTQKEVFEPIIADWQAEYFEALFKKEIWKARWINVRYTYAFLAAMWQKSPIGDLIEFVVKIAKQ